MTKRLAVCDFFHIFAPKQTFSLPDNMITHLKTKTTMNTRQDQALRPTTHRCAFPFVPLLATFLFTILCLPAFSETKPPEEEGVFYQTVNGANLKFKIYKGSSPVMVDVLGFATDAAFSGKLTIPASVTYEGTQYDIRAIQKNSFQETNITQLVVKRCWGIFSNALRTARISPR